MGAPRRTMQFRKPDPFTSSRSRSAISAIVQEFLLLPPIFAGFRNNLPALQSAFTLFEMAQHFLRAGTARFGECTGRAGMNGPRVRFARIDRPAAPAGPIQGCRSRRPPLRSGARKGRRDSGWSLRRPSSARAVPASRSRSRERASRRARAAKINRPVSTASASSRSRYGARYGDRRPACPSRRRPM